MSVISNLKNYLKCCYLDPAFNIKYDAVEMQIQQISINTSPNEIQDVMENLSHLEEEAFKDRPCLLKKCAKLNDLVISFEHQLQKRNDFEQEKMDNLKKKLCTWVHPSTLMAFPMDLIKYICQFLNVRDYLNFVCSSKNFYQSSATINKELGSVLQRERADLKYAKTCMHYLYNLPPHIKRPIDDNQDPSSSHIAE